MKMAKASRADIDMALTLSTFLDSIDKGYMPDAVSIDPEHIEWLHNDDGEQCCRIVQELREILSHGSLFRVTFGMAVVCDPANKCIDPDADTIEHHPIRQQMQNALLWTLYHHQGGSSHIGQPIRALLGIGQYDRLSDEQLAAAKSFGEARMKAVDGGAA